MREQYSHHNQRDPLIPNWQALTLPDAWPDQLNFRRPGQLLKLIRQITNKRRPAVQLPDGTPGAGKIPKYVLQEFHNLPNGNYSKRITRGYITSFEKVMLGHMEATRDTIAAHLQHLDSVLDVGCAGGRTAAAIKEAGVTDVWAIDPSPYLLKYAAEDFPDIKFVQAVAEDTGFSDRRFNGIATCFVLHEIPPRYIDRALAEFHRILDDRGLLVIAEPSALQLRQTAFAIFKRWGLKGLYFRSLAKRTHEPFIDAWHGQNICDKLTQFGFSILSDDDDLPIRKIVAQKN